MNIEKYELQRWISCPECGNENIETKTTRKRIILKCDRCRVTLSYPIRSIQ